MMRATICIALFLLALFPATAQEWAIPEADMRLRLSVSGDLYQRDDTDLATVIDFNALLGQRRVLAADGLTLVQASFDEPLEIRLAEDAELRYASGNPILWLEWASGPLDRFEARQWDLYLRTVERGSPDAWQTLERTFSPGDPMLLWDTSFEQAEAGYEDRPVGMIPGGADKDGETTERVWTDVTSRSGERCLKIARRFEGEPPKNSNRPHWRSWPPRIFVRPGQGIRATGWLSVPELAQGSLASMTLEFYGAENKRLSENRVFMRDSVVPHEDWVQLVGQTTAPDAAESAVIWFSLHGAGRAYCDDLTVTALPGGELPALQVQVGDLLRNRATVVEAAPGEERVLTATTAEAPPVLDGQLDDPCWATAGRVDNFEVFMQTPGARVSTTVFACADRDALYFGFDCLEVSTDTLLAATTERDGPVWTDDSVELFLDTNRDLQTFYQIIVNPRGVFFDQDAGAPGLAGAKWDGPITTATSIHPGGWRAEVKLEFAGLRLAEAQSQVWGANFARTSYRDGRSAYTWARVKSGFLEPANFGRLVLPIDPTANAVTGRPLAGEQIFGSEGLLPVETVNRRDDPVQVRVVATAAEGGTGGEVLAQLERGMTAVAQIPAEFDLAGETRVTYELFEQPSGRLLYTTTVTHTVPEALEIAPDHLVSYLDEDLLTGGWETGLSETALGEVTLSLDVVDAEGTALATAQIELATRAGEWILGVGDVPAGRYLLRAKLQRAGQLIVTREHSLDRIAGPFGGATD